MIFSVQYSHPTENRIATSEWKENIRKIEAFDSKDAIKKCNKLCENLGTWMILDCWKD